MSAFDVAEARILVALFISHHSENRQLLSWQQLEAEYHTRVSQMQFEAISAELEAKGVVKMFRDKDGSSVVLLDQGVRYAHDRILQFLNADIFDVNWKTERILTDAPGDIDIPFREGWMLLHTEKNVDREPRAARAAQTSMAGIPHRVSAGRDVIMNVGSPGAHAQSPTEKLKRHENGWGKWQTILTAIGVLLAAITIAVMIYIGR